MQLGTRWLLGDEPPARLSAEVIAAIRTVETTAPEGSRQRRWTLTWLEGRPIVELDPLDDSEEFTIITVHPANGMVTIGTAGSGDEKVEDEL